MRTKSEIIQSGTATEEELYQLGLEDGENSFMDLNLANLDEYMRGYREGLKNSFYSFDYCSH